MSEVRDLAARMEQLRQKMYKLLEQKSDLMDPEILNTSRALDDAINEYCREYLPPKCIECENG